MLQKIRIDQTTVRVADPLKVIKVILGLQLVEGAVEHPGLFLDVAIAIVIILKPNHDKRLVVPAPNLASVSDFPTIIDFHRTIPLRVDTLNNKSVNPRGYFLLQVILRWRNSSYFVTTKNQIVI